MKKLISILLTAVMSFSLTTVAFAAEETPEVSEDSITSILLEAAKAASTLNDEARKKLGEEIEKLLVEQIAGDNPVLQQGAQWIIDTALTLSGSDSILDVDKEQAEKIAEFLTKVYDGDVAEYIDNPIISLIVSLVPEEIFKEAVVWLLSDGLGDTIDNFIKENGGDTEEESEEEEEPSSTNPLEGIDWAVAFEAAMKAIKDFFELLIEAITNLFSGAGSTPAVQ